MIELVASKGLGDAIMLRCVVIHMLKRGDELTVYTPWIDVFSDLACKNLTVLHRSVLQDRNHKGVRNAIYQFYDPAQKHRNQFEMVCWGAGIREPVPFDLQWTVKNKKMVDRIKQEANGKQILIYQPVKKWNNIEQQLTRPDKKVFRDLISDYSEYHRIRTGHPAWSDIDTECPYEKDLFGPMPIDQIFDMCTAADLFVSEPVYLPIIAEALDKPYVCMFTRRALNSGYKRINCMKPDRMFYKPGLGTARYDET